MLYNLVAIWHNVVTGDLNDGIIQKWISWHKYTTYLILRNLTKVRQPKHCRHNYGECGNTIGLDNFFRHNILTLYNCVLTFFRLVLVQVFKLSYFYTNLWLGHCCVMQRANRERKERLQQSTSRNCKIVEKYSVKLFSLSK